MLRCAARPTVSLSFKRPDQLIPRYATAVPTLRFVAVPRQQLQSPRANRQGEDQEGESENESERTENTEQGTGYRVTG